MLFIVMACLSLAAIVVGIVMIVSGGASSGKRMARRMEARAARLDYLRLARETDTARRLARAGTGDSAAEAGPESSDAAPDNDGSETGDGQGRG